MEEDPRLPSASSNHSTHSANRSNPLNRTSAQLSLEDDPNEARTSFLRSDYDRAIEGMHARFPFVQDLYLTKIFRGRLNARGLVWLDHDREDMTPTESHSLSHLLYCFEVYGQIICMFAADGNDPADVQELQSALADFRIRILKLVKTHTFESVKAWFEAFFDEVVQVGQDNPKGWRASMHGLKSLLKRRVLAPDGDLNGQLALANSGEKAKHGGHEVRLAGFT